MKLPIYMDNHATTQVDPRVVEAMLPYFTEQYGNAASRNHVFGWKAEEAVETARAQIAGFIGATPKEIVFTSGATESDNLAIKGVAEAYKDKGNHIVTCVTEHKAVLDSCHRLETQGYEVTYLPVSRTGRVDPEAVRAAITDRTILISIMFANNEIGTIHPVEEIGRIAHEADVLFHCDGVQALARVPVDVLAQNIDLMSLTAHKMYGPKGVGALYVRRRSPRVRVASMFDGGGQENRMRSGTLNVPGIVGFGKAAEIAESELPEEAARILRLREKLHAAIARELDEVYLNGDPEHRLPGNLNLSFAYVEGEALLLAMKDVAVSSGSACTSASMEASYVLRALGAGDALAHASIRYGLGRFTSEEEVDYVADLTIRTVRKLRSLSPLHEAAKRAEYSS
jgi:cysteine desulfurase